METSQLVKGLIGDACPEIDFSITWANGIITDTNEQITSFFVFASDMSGLYIFLVSLTAFFVNRAFVFHCN